MVSGINIKILRRFRLKNRENTLFFVVWFSYNCPTNHCVFPFMQ